jgi:hypothetical protein
VISFSKVSGRFRMSGQDGVPRFERG